LTPKVVCDELRNCAADMPGESGTAARQDGKMGTFKIRDLMVTLRSDDNCDDGIDDSFFPGCRASPCVQSPPRLGKEIEDLGSQELSELKQQLQVTLAQVADREKALQDQADAVGKTIEGMELEALETKLSAALADVQGRIANLKPPGTP
jgi:hypothetical protein